MKILLDIGHPAHVHLYRNFYFEMEKKGHEIVVTVKDLPSACQLLDFYNIPYVQIGKKGGSIIGKGASQLLFNGRILRLVMRKKIDLGVGSSITNAQISRITSMKSIIFDDDDDDVQPLMVRFGHPFAHCVLSPDALYGTRRKKGTIYYAGYHELAYLHPNRFTPDPSVLEDAGLKEGETFFIMRFNAFKAHHDIGIRGLSKEYKIKLTEYLSRIGKVFITTESNIEPELAGYSLKIPSYKIHSLISYSAMFIGDSQTMTSEASVLGIPSLRCNSFAGRISYLSELEERYGLTFAFKPDDFDSLIVKLKEILSMRNMKTEFQQRMDKMLVEKIDVTAFMVWFVENFPVSVEIMKNNPGIQNSFH